MFAGNESPIFHANDQGDQSDEEQQAEFAGKESHPANSPNSPLADRLTFRFKFKNLCSRERS